MFKASCKGIKGKTARHLVAIFIDGLSLFYGHLKTIMDKIIFEFSAAVFGV